jgi:DNA-binding transcriptional LysR family regulator
MANMRTFDLNLLRLLDALLSERQVSSAARRLNLSQPAMSSGLARLRAALADPLLVRSGNRMLPTPAAVALQPRVRAILAEIDATLQAPAVFDPARSDRSFRILANDYAATVLLAPLAHAIVQQAPNARLEILPLEERFTERLAQHDYDLAMRDDWALRGWRRRERLLDETYLGLARRGHPRLSARPSLDAFLAEGHLLISPAGRTAGVVDTALARIGRRRRVAVTVPHFLAAPAIVARTDLAVTLARRIALQLADTYQLNAFPLPFKLPGFALTMAWHARAEADSAVTWLKAQVRQVVRQIGGKLREPRSAD